MSFKRNAVLWSSGNHGDGDRNSRGVFLVSCTPVVGEDGKIDRVIHFATDITGKKQKEEALRESEARYRALIQAIQAAVVLHDSDTQIVATNQTAQELLGLSEEEMLGKTSVDSVWNFLREDGSIMPPEEYPVNQVLARRKPLRDFVGGIRRPDKNATVTLHCQLLVSFEINNPHVRILHLGPLRYL